MKAGFKSFPKLFSQYLDRNANYEIEFEQIWNWLISYDFQEWNFEKNGFKVKRV